MSQKLLTFDPVHIFSLSSLSPILSGYPEADVIANLKRQVLDNAKNSV